MISVPLATHSCELFANGYQHKLELPHEKRIDLSLRGLNSFLKIPRDFFNVTISRMSDCQSALVLQHIRSAAVAGILEGFSHVRFGDEEGTDVLSRRLDDWMAFVVLLIPRHAESIISVVKKGAVLNGLRRGVLPVLDALEMLLKPADETSVRGWSAERYDPEHQRVDLDVSFTEAGLLRISVFLASDTSAEAIIDHDRDIVVVESRSLGERRRTDRTREPYVVLVSADDDREMVAQRVFDAMLRFSSLHHATARHGTGRPRSGRADEQSGRPVAENIARDFPLNDLKRLRTFYCVRRNSVSDMLQGAKDGVCLWCSVRRSGKTTACYDLGNRIHDSALIYQTCLPDPSPDSGILYNAIRTAVEEVRSISRTFLGDTIKRSGANHGGQSRTILILDEYERLFGFLHQHAARSDNRRAVVEQILDQLYMFSDSNLLVFMGQRPDAYKILMSSSHLAYRVRQEPFPLLVHGPAAEEFAEFVVDKVLSTERTGVGCTEQFLDALFEETAGHPFLIVNVLVDFVDWLIERGRFGKGSTMEREVFAEFVQSRLSIEEILLPGQNEEGYYAAFFSGAAEEALGRVMGAADPWLYAVYWTLRLIAVKDPVELCVSLEDFRDLVNKIPRIPETELPGYQKILTTATMANFLSYDVKQRNVRVKIRTLGRISAAVEPQLA